jgi:fatty acid desaturase
MRPRLHDLALHLLRVAGCIAALALVSGLGPIPAGLASVGLFFAAFALMHDLAHGALRLPRRVNEVALSAAGALMLMSGHALRRTHLLHHARCLAPDDYEGAPARWSFTRACLLSPAHAVGLRAYAFRLAGPGGRRWQLAETALNLACLVLIACLGIPALSVVAIVAVAAQLTMAVWAAHVPHNAPRRLAAAAAHAARLGSIVALSLAYHDLHHERPDVPCGRIHA